MSTNEQGDRLLQTVAACGAALSAGSGAASAQTKAPAAAAPVFEKLPPWKVIYYLEYRIPQGKLDEFVSHWGGTQVPTLEKRTGQALWGGWSCLTGPDNVLTHNWAYRDLGHYETAGTLRRTDPEVVAAFGRQTVPIQGNLTSTFIERLSYHPETYPDPQREPGIIATHRINTNMSAAPGPRDKEHQSAASEYVQAAAKHGAKLVGAFQTMTGVTTPNFQLHVWRYADMKHYWDSRAAIEADPECRRLLAVMRDVYPQEIVQLHRPLSYSRLR